MKKIYFFSIAYILISVLLVPVSGTNPRSRLALQNSLCENLEYSINQEMSGQSSPAWTIDWAKTPEGKYFSNKAPGPSLLALPLHCSLYWLSSWGLKTPGDRLARQWKFLYPIELALSLFLQIIPLIFFAIYFIKKESCPHNNKQKLIFLVSLFYGSTASLYMNSWFGHGLPALLFLGLLFSMLQSRFYFAGFFWSWLFISDYSTPYLILPVFYLFIVSTSHLGKQRITSALKILIASVPAFLLWAHYHIKNFGGLLKLPQHFQNPQFLDNPHAAGQISAVMSFIPKPWIIAELLFGPKRGILFTQPWVLLLIVFSLIKWKTLPSDLRKIFIFVLLSFASLLLMNASFGQWHAGSAAGPRYLSSVLLSFPVLLFYLYPFLNRPEKYALSLGLGISLLLFAWAQATTIIPPPDPLWETLFLRATEKTGTFALRMSLFFLFFLPPFFLFLKRK